MSSVRQLMRCALAIVYGHRLSEDATRTGYPQGFWCRYTTEPVELSARGLGCSYAKVLEYLC